MEITDVNARVERAVGYFTSGYNCCQSVVMAFDDLTGLDTEILARASAGFGGGMGRMREVCGAVSGMTFLAGFISPVTNPSDLDARKANYAIVQHFAGKFREKTGSIVCRELLGLPSKIKEEPTPAPRTPEYYRKRPCVELVALAAGIVAEYCQNNP